MCVVRTANELLCSKESSSELQWFISRFEKFELTLAIDRNSIKIKGYTIQIK